MSLKNQNVRKKCIYPDCKKDARSTAIPYCSSFHCVKLHYVTYTLNGYIENKTDEEIYEIMKKEKEKYLEKK